MGISLKMKLKKKKHEKSLLKSNSAMKFKAKNNINRRISYDNLIEDINKTLINLPAP